MRFDQKRIGALLLIVGLIWLLSAWNMSTSVSTGGYSIGDSFIPSRSVVNLDKQDRRRNHLLIATLVTLSGVMLLGFSSISGSAGINLSRQSYLPKSTPPCARDLSLDAYKIWLVSKYRIVKNEALGGIVCKDSLFSTIEEALTHAHALEVIEVASAEEAARRRQATAEEFKRLTGEAMRWTSAHIKNVSTSLSRELGVIWSQKKKLVIAVFAGVILIVIGAEGVIYYIDYRHEQSRIVEATKAKAKAKAIEDAVREKTKVAESKWRAVIAEELGGVSFAVTGAEFDRFGKSLEIEYNGGALADVYYTVVFKLKNELGQLDNNTIGSGYGATTNEIFYGFNGLNDDIVAALNSARENPISIIESAYILVDGRFSSTMGRDRLERLTPLNFPPLEESAELSEPLRFELRLPADRVTTTSGLLPADQVTAGGAAMLAADLATSALLAADRVTTASGLQYQILTAADGKKPAADDTVKVHYRGTLLDGTEFDSSYARSEPATFPVNAVIPGWTEALQLMPVGSKWKLWIPSELAYGAGGAGDKIPPNATLIFEVELLSIEND